MSALERRVHTLGEEVAAKHAVAVDREARFPGEAFAALKEQGLLGVMVPRELGGESASMAEVASFCHALGQSCAATAMIYAMHQIQVACLARHAAGSAWHRDLMRRLATEQLLLASATSESGIGGDVRRSSCAVEAIGTRFTLEKNASVISYGAHADGILVTARREPAAPASDQVLVAVLAADYRLEQTSEWDTLGMRGTCSCGYALKAAGRTEQILPAPYADISARTMLPVSHLTWTSLWLGIATDALARAQGYIRAEARKKPGTTPAGAVQLAEATATLQLMRSNVLMLLDRHERAQGGDEAVSLSAAVAMNNLKVTVSRLAVEVINQALMVCGIAGYRNDSPFSLGRHLRDAHSAALMVNNDRIMGNTANLLLACRPARELLD